MARPHFLLVSTEGEFGVWKETVSKATKSIANLEVVHRNMVDKIIMSQVYDLVIIDALGLEDSLVITIEKIRKAQPEIPVVVATDIPTWTQAREVLRAGATDYVAKTLDVGDIGSSLQSVLLKTGRRP